MKGLKLSNKQVEVLANKIYQELKDEANKYKQSEEYNTFETTLKNDVVYKQWSKLEKALTDAKEQGLFTDSYYATCLLNGKKKYVETKLESAFKSSVLPTVTSIENNIILNTIDTESLEDLINKVKNSLK